MLYTQMQVVSVEMNQHAHRHRPHSIYNCMLSVCTDQSTLGLAARRIRLPCTPESHIDVQTDYAMSCSLLCCSG